MGGVDDMPGKRSCQMDWLLWHVAQKHGEIQPRDYDKHVWIDSLDALPGNLGGVSPVSSRSTKAPSRRPQWGVSHLVPDVEADDSGVAAVPAAELDQALHPFFCGVGLCEPQPFAVALAAAPSCFRYMIVKDGDEAHVRQSFHGRIENLQGRFAQELRVRGQGLLGVRHSRRGCEHLQAVWQPNTIELHVHNRLGQRRQRPLVQASRNHSLHVGTIPIYTCELHLLTFRTA
mmetsp:Transcript_67691/g.141467  ORF Transcript_67691/g.141467 Transcript_67691/m.141467 type:complete len:231 (-) Transcript_67691:13-705(-)